MRFTSRERPRKRLRPQGPLLALREKNHKTSPPPRLPVESTSQKAKPSHFQVELDDSGFEGGADAQKADGDGEFEAAGAGAAGVEVEDAVRAGEGGAVGVAADDRGVALRRGGVDVVDIVH